MKVGTTLLIGVLVATSAGIVLAAGRSDGFASAAVPPETVSPVPATLRDVDLASDAQPRVDRARFADRLNSALQDRSQATLVDAPVSRRRPAQRSAEGPARPVSLPDRVESPLPVRTQADEPVNIAAALTRPTDPVDCLAQAIYYEARSESEEGQAAVAEVILNRARSGRYPRAVCDVVYQRNARTCQFSYTCDGSIGRFPVNRRAWATAERIARDVYGGRTATILPERSVNYHADYVAPGWGRRLERVRQIGAHIFYGAPLSGQTPGATTDTRPNTGPRDGLVFVRLDALDRAYQTVQEAFQPTSPGSRSGPSTAAN
ncbi:MAG: cell wall hydrolase [Caulobacteraceae bacterium]|nr:cell wall hydrolase [Caulobacteraceae bacterium]